MNVRKAERVRLALSMETLQSDRSHFRRANPVELAIYVGSRKHFEKPSHVCSGERLVSKYHLLSFTQKDSMSNMHTLIHDNTFVIIQEIRAFHKNSLARAYGAKKTAPPGSMNIDPG